MLHTIASVLQELVRIPDSELGILQIKDGNSAIQGEIGILRGTYAIGARLTADRRHGYEALKLLLRLKSGTYRYSDHSEDYPEELDNGFKIRLVDLINSYPTLPDKLEQIVSGRNSLNRIRAMELEVAEQAEEQQKQKVDKLGPVLSQWKSLEQSTLKLRTKAFWCLFIALCAYDLWFLYSP